MLKKSFVNEFVLKIIALVTMTLDHVGIFLLDYSGANLANNPFTNAMFTTGFIFRVIGRIAFPLYIFMIVEGVRHTRNFWKYLLRLGVVAVIILSAQIVISIALMDISSFSSPFIDLVVIAIMVYLLKRKDKLSFLALIPIAYLVFTTVIQVIERANHLSIIWFPEVIRPSYSFFGLCIGLGFYFAYELAYVGLIKKENRFKEVREYIETTSEYRLMVNIYSIIFLFITNVILFLTAYININGVEAFMIYSQGLDFNNIQTYSVIAGVFLLFYNGRRGYNKLWFKYFNYAYFPLHIIIIFFVFYIIFR